MCKAKEAGVTNFACIHDSFGVLAPDVVQMGLSLRESFVSIFQEKNLLEDFKTEILDQVKKEDRNKIPSVPKKGDLDVSGVINSDYFCSLVLR